MQSFVPAFNSMELLLKNEHNTWAHLFFMLANLVFGTIVQLNSVEWLFIALAVSLVFLSELFNTALEKLADKVDPNFTPINRGCERLCLACCFIRFYFCGNRESACCGTKSDRAYLWSLNRVKPVKNTIFTSKNKVQLFT